MAKPKVADPERQALLETIRELSVLPFQERLAEALLATPTFDALKEFALKKPGEWATYVKTLANLAGYAERKELKVGGLIAHIHEMSDAELLERARQMGSPKVIDNEP